MSEKLENLNETLNPYEHSTSESVEQEVKDKDRTK